MLSVFGSSYLIVNEMDVHWMPAAAIIPVGKAPPKEAYPVWLMDSLGVRAHIFIRCPNCQSVLGLSPSDAQEQGEWNKKEPEINNIFGCTQCSSIWMLTSNKAYHLVALPVPPQTRTPRIFTMPPMGGAA